MAVFIVILIVVALFIWLRIKGPKYQKKLKAKQEASGIPADAPVLEYLGGHPGMKEGRVYATSSESALVFISRLSKEKTEVPFAQILGVQLQSNVQSVNTGGGRSITGAIVGDAIAGPLGAVVGSRKKSKVKTFDHSTVQIRVKNSQGIEYAMVFKGGQSTYNELTRLLNAAI